MGACSTVPLPQTEEARARQWHEAITRGDCKLVARLLAECPHFLTEVDKQGCTALYRAAEHGHDKVVAQLLAVQPALINTIDGFGWTCLSGAVLNGRDKVVAQLLAISPGLAWVPDTSQKIPLHLAAGGGHDTVVSQLLAASPESVRAIDGQDWTALHYAVYRDQVSCVEVLLAHRPQLVFAKDKRGNTALHVAAQRSLSPRLIASLLQVSPNSLSREFNENCKLPFHVAVDSLNDCAVDLLQWFLSIDELAAAFSRRMAVESDWELGAFSFRRPHSYNYKLRLRPLMEQQCESLLSYLCRDVVDIVYEYVNHWD